MAVAETKPHAGLKGKGLRIVLLGYRYAGKSSSGNTILGREEFDTVERSCHYVKREGEVAGRHVTVVKAPGWWWDDTVEETTTMTKEDIELSVSLCPPGPHALLLIIEMYWLNGSFTETHRRSAQEHLEILGERVWNHTIVLFTYGDWLGDSNIEKYMESEGESLRWLVEKCGNRYHVLNNERKDDRMQVTQLMEKIEEMLAANRGQCYEMERRRIEELEEKRRRDEKRGYDRMMKAREFVRSQMGHSRQLSQFRIVLLGYSFAGRSSSRNTILVKQKFDTVGANVRCVKIQGEVAGRHVTLVEAPGWDYINAENTQNMTKEDTELSVTLCHPGPHALVLAIRVNRSFTEELRSSMQQHLALLGERVWRHTIVLFTCGNCLGDTTIEQYIESEGESLQWLVEQCGNRYHVFNNEMRDDHMQVTQLMEKIEEMVAANRGQCYGMERRRTEELEEKRRRDEERGKKRMMKTLPRLQEISTSDQLLLVKEAASYDLLLPSKPGGETLPVRKAQSYEWSPPDMSRDSDRWSSTSSAYRSFRSVSCSAYSSFRLQPVPGEQQSQPVQKAQSYDLIPPMMRGDSDRWSFTSSAYSSFRSTASSDISSLQGSIKSTTSSQSSGIGSLSSRAGSVQCPDSRRFKYTDMRQALRNIPESPESKGHDEEDRNKSINADLEFTLL